MNLKKLMAIGLSVCMVASLAACGGDKDKEPEKAPESQVQEEEVQQEPEVKSPYDGLDISDESLLMGNILNGVVGNYLSDKYVTILSVDQEGASDALKALGVDTADVEELAVMYGKAIPADVVTEIGLAEDSELYNEKLATDETEHTFIVGMIKTADVDKMVETIKTTAVKDDASEITYDTVAKSATNGYVVFSVNTEYALGDSSFIDMTTVDSALTAGLTDPDSVVPVISLGSESEDLESLDDATNNDETSNEETDVNSDETEVDATDVVDNTISSEDGNMEVTESNEVDAGEAVGAAGVGANGAPNTSSTWQ